jgi:hypothetical protein
MIRRAHSSQARLPRVKAQGIDLSRSPWSTPGPLTSSPCLKDASPQGRAHAQSPGNPVRLRWLDESHDVIQTRIHDETSQPLCLTSKQFGNYEVLRQQETPCAQRTKCCISQETPYAQQCSAASRKDALLATT